MTVKKNWIYMASQFADFLPDRSPWFCTAWLAILIAIYLSDSQFQGLSFPTFSMKFKQGENLPAGTSKTRSHMKLFFCIIPILVDTKWLSCMWGVVPQSCYNCPAIRLLSKIPSAQHKHVQLESKNLTLALTAMAPSSLWMQWWAVMAYRLLSRVAE